MNGFYALLYKLFFLLLVLTGCATEKRCFEKFPLIPDTLTRVIYRDSVVYRDTVITIQLEGDLVTDTIILPCTTVNTSVRDTARAETKLAEALAWVEYPNIILRLIQKDTTIEARLDSVIREAYHWKTEYINITKTQTIKKIPAIYRISLGINIGILVVILLLILVSIVFRK